MSFAGFKKQFNKTSQLLSEKVGGNKGSQLEEDFVDVERRLDVMNECVENMQNKTKEFLQPNPSARTKLAVQTTYQKARGAQGKQVKYTQPEFNLAEVFSKGGGGLNDLSPYATSLVEIGSSFNQLSEIKDSMEFDVKQNYLDPLYEIQQKDLKDINQHRKKMESRRLDYDYKKGKGAKVSDEELQTAEEKFIESKQISYNSMMNFIDSDVDHIGQLLAFTEAIRDYHKQCADVMESCTNALSSKLAEAASRPRKERLSISLSPSDDNSSVGSYDMSDINRNSGVPPVSKPPLVKQQPHCLALYDFEAENDGELAFTEGTLIELKGRIDENWMEGSCNGRQGYFPENYVEILEPL